MHATNTPRPLQRLLINGKQPPDESTVSEAEIQAGATLRLTFRLPGGGRCRACLAAGLEVPALPGHSVCEAHRARLYGSSSSNADTSRSDPPQRTIERASGVAPPPGLSGGDHTPANSASSGQARLPDPAGLPRDSSTTTSPEIPSETPTGDSHASSGLSQQVQEMHISDTRGQTPLRDAMPDPGTAPPVSPAPTPPVPALLSPAEACTFLRDIIEQEALTHFHVVRAAQHLTPSVIPRDLSSLANFSQTLKALGYFPDSPDAWARLGLSPLEGPDVDLTMIEARGRFVRILASAIPGTAWPSTDKDEGLRIRQRIEAAVDECGAGLALALREKRRIKPSKLPSWRELGEQALRLVLSCALDPSEVVATQWSDLLAIDRTSLSPGQCMQTLLPLQARRLADKAEVGNTEFWRLAEARPCVIWAPKDEPTLGRLLTPLLRGTLGPLSPPYVKLLVPMDLFPGCTTFRQIADLWSHALLREKWAPLVRNVEVFNRPLDFVSSSPSGPRHELRGLCLFTLSTRLPRAEPSLARLPDPVVEIAALPFLTVDYPLEDSCEVFRALQALPSLLPRMSQPRRSPAHSRDHPRARLDLRFPLNTPRLEQEAAAMLLRPTLPGGVFFGSHELYTEPAALLVEFGHPGSLQACWKLCSGAIPLSPSKALVTSEASADAWREALDASLLLDPSHGVFGIRWKPSRHGGRPFASPSMVPQQLAATRRARDTSAQSLALQSITDVEVVGAITTDEHAVVTQLMAHLAHQAAVPLTEATTLAGAGPNAWFWLSRGDPLAPPGRARLFLTDPTAVARVRAALHGRSVRVGLDHFAIRVTNDLLDARPPTAGGS